MNKFIDILLNIFAFLSCAFFALMLGSSTGYPTEVHFRSNHVGENQITCLSTCMPENSNYPPGMPPEIRDCKQIPECPIGYYVYIDVVSIDQSNLMDVMRQLRDITEVKK